MIYYNEDIKWKNLYNNLFIKSKFTKKRPFSDSKVNSRQSSEKGNMESN
jgi:hypothetical protein